MKKIVMAILILLVFSTQALAMCPYQGCPGDNQTYITKSYFKTILKVDSKAIGKGIIISDTSIKDRDCKPICNGSTCVENPNCVEYSGIHFKDVTFARGDDLQYEEHLKFSSDEIEKLNATKFVSATDPNANIHTKTVVKDYTSGTLVEDKDIFTNQLTKKLNVKVTTNNTIHSVDMSTIQSFKGWHEVKIVKKDIETKKQEDIRVEKIFSGEMTLEHSVTLNTDKLDYNVSVNLNP